MFAALAGQDRTEMTSLAAGAIRQCDAGYDTLTRLPNRALFSSRMGQLLSEPARDRRLGVCYVDLDRFEAVNDVLGHRVGDRLLMAAAGRLHRLAFGSGHILARMDSDKFAILMRDTHCPAEAVALAKQTLRVLSEPFRVDQHSLRVTASAGVVERPTAGASPAEMIRAADIALHWAKAEGKARYRLYESERDDRDRARHRLAAAMPAALEYGEFTLLYQPLVDLASGRAVGAEALARWRHPERGLLGPDQFIEMAEDNGLIVRLGTTLLRQACREAATWTGTGAVAPYVSVNLAPAQIADPDLVNTVVEAVERAGLPPERLQLEITEHAVIEPDGSALDALRDLANIGVRIAIDDFGTGYSNLASLPALPLCELKLALPFVQGTTDRGPARLRGFLAAIVGLGGSLNLTVTAEGIETAEQAQLMRDIGCHTGQGWYFGRPLTAERIARRMRDDWRPHAPRRAA